MSGAAALRIVNRQRVYFEPDENDSAEITSRRDRYSWAPKVTNNAYDAMKPGFANPIEAKVARSEMIERPTYPRSVAQMFWIGCIVFVVGLVLLASSAVTSNNALKYVSWPVLTIGAAVAALCLLRAQDLDQ